MIGKEERDSWPPKVAELSQTLAEPSSIDIEGLMVWTYRDQCAHELERGDGIRIGYAQSSLSERVSGGVQPWEPPPDVHDDAERVHTVVMGLPPAVRDLVIGHGLAASRPDWLPGALFAALPVLRAVRVDDHSIKGVPTGGGHVAEGRPSWIYDCNRNKVGIKVMYGVELDGGEFMRGWTMDRIAQERKKYTLWRAALAGLVIELPGVLSSWVLTDDLPPECPWCVEG